MKNTRTLSFFGFAIAAAVLAFPITAKAACTNPAGDEGDQVYNSTHKVMQFCNNSDWISMAGGATASAASTMVSGWPDAIKCNDKTMFIVQDNSGGSVYYRQVWYGNNVQVTFNSDGTYNSNTSAAGCEKSISQLYTDGQAFNFVGGGSGGGSVVWLDGGSGKRYYNGGNVGIGTMSPHTKLTVLNGLIHVGENLTDQKVALGFDAANDRSFITTHDGTETVRDLFLDGQEIQLATESLIRLTVDNNGNVGIGTDNPEHELHVKSASDASMMIEAGGTDDWSEIDFKSSYNVADEGYWNIAVEGHTGKFMVRNFSDARAVNDIPLTILENGNVGIGTASPGEKFSIGTAFNFHDGGSDVLAWSGDYTGSQWDRIGGAAYQGQISFTPSNGSFQIYSSNTDGTTATFPNKFLTLVGTTGNVGIGTDNPGAKLDVAGAAEVNGQLDMVSNKIVNLATPTAAADAATKAYVDAASGGGGVPAGTMCGLARGANDNNCSGTTFTSINTCQGVDVRNGSCPSGYTNRYWETGEYDAGGGDVYANCSRTCFKN